ncbi:DUF1353 domain-containing protein [Wenyingzhuangia sp. IMCC45533]
MAKFSGYPLTRWKGNRLMILEEDFSYTDKKGKVWLSPKGGELNGATIPRRLWGFIGSPFVGIYRRASVVHDYFVGEGNNPNVTYRERRRADKMFYRACRTDGCSWRFGAILYIGVSIGSWSSRIGLKHSMINENLESLSFEEDKLIETKYLDLRAKAEEIISGQENFEALEQLVENEIEK